MLTTNFGSAILRDCKIYAANQPLTLRFDWLGFQNQYPPHQNCEFEDCHIKGMGTFRNCNFNNCRFFGNFHFENCTFARFPKSGKLTSPNGTGDIAKFCLSENYYYGFTDCTFQDYGKRLPGYPCNFRGHNRAETYAPDNLATPKTRRPIAPNL